jgi:hypothetical protein
MQKMKLKGDFRLRHQTQNKDNDNTPRRERWRMRMRLGVITDVNDQWKVGFGLATGGTDPRSTNQTLEETFQSPDVRIDYAYAQYKPFDWLTALGGKFKNPLWRPKDLLWDSDIRPDGLAAPLEFKINSDVDLFITPAYFILDEFSDRGGNPDMFLAQAGVNWKINDPLSLKLAASYYGFNDLVGNSFTHSSGSNSTDANGNLLYDYDSFSLDAQAGYKLDGIVPYLAAFGQYVSADSDDDDTGYLVGVKFGHKKVKKLGQWGFKYNYRRLERNAWPDFLPDSDFYGGKTNAKGHEFELKFGLAKNIIFGLDYYLTEQIIGSDNEEDLLQADLVVKW